MVQNSEHFSALQNGSELNSENFLFRGAAGIPPEQTCCSAEQPEFRRNKPVVPRNSRNSAGTNLLFRLFRLPRNYFLSEIANPNPKSN
jgi:hypothetical protein